MKDGKTKQKQKRREEPKKVRNGARTGPTEKTGQLEQAINGQKKDRQKDGQTLKRTGKNKNAKKDSQTQPTKKTKTLNGIVERKRTRK